MFPFPGLGPAPSSSTVNATQLQGQIISVVVPVAGQALSYYGGNWVPGAVIDGGTWTIPAIPTIRATSSNTGSTTAVTVTAPTNVNGDLLLAVAVIDYQKATTDIAPPAGWTAVSGFPQYNSGNQKVYAWTKTAASEGASYVFTPSSAESTAIRIIAFTGNCVIDVVGTFFAGSGTSSTASSVTTTAANRLVIEIFTGINAGGTRTITVPGGSAVIGSTLVSATDTVNFVYLSMASLSAPTLGATGSQVATWNTSTINYNVQLAVYSTVASGTINQAVQAWKGPALAIPTTAPQGQILYATDAKRAYISNGDGTNNYIGGFDVVSDIPAFVGFTLADVALGDSIPEYNLALLANRIVTLERIAGYINPGLNEFRLSCLTNSAFPVDTAGATSVYLTPKESNLGTISGNGRIAISDGTRPKLYNSSEISSSLSGMTPGTYDYFVYDLAGSPFLESLAWNPNSTGTITAASNATPIVITSTAHGLTADMCVYISGVGGNTNANGVYRVGTVAANTFQLLTYAGASRAGNASYTSGGTWWRIDQTTTRATDLDIVDGVLYKHGDYSRRYVGSIFIYQTGQVDDTGQPATATPARRHIYSHCNKIDRPARIIDSATTWTSTNSTIHPWHTSLNNRVEVLIGWLDSQIEVLFGGAFTHSTGGVFCGLAVGLDSLTTMAAGLISTGDAPAGVNDAGIGIISGYLNPTAVGFHTIQALEWASSAGTSTFVGVTSLAGKLQSGLVTCPRM